MLREDVLPALQLSQTELAKRLGVGRLSVFELLLEKRAMSADMAIRVATLTPESSLRMQESVDENFRLTFSVEQRARALSPLCPGASRSASSRTAGRVQRQNGRREFCSRAEREAWRLARRPRPPV